MDLLIYLPFVLIAIMVTVQVRAFFGTKLIRGKQLSELAELLHRQGADSDRLLVYFFSDHCPQCPPITALVDKLAGEYDNVIKIDALRESAVVKHFGIRATPTVVRVVDGAITDVVVGSTSEKKLRSLLDAA